VHHLEIQQGSTTKFLEVIQKTAMETLLLEPANCNYTVISLNNTALYSGVMNFSGTEFFTKREQLKRPWRTTHQLNKDLEKQG
jgi:hypothetical protein